MLRAGPATDILSPVRLQITQAPLRTLTARAMSSGGVNSVEEKRLFETLNKIDGLLLTQDLGGVDKLFTKDAVFHSDGITLPQDLKGIDAVRGRAEATYMFSDAGRHSRSDYFLLTQDTMSSTSRTMPIGMCQLHWA